MVYEQYDFARNPIVEDQVFFLESKCTRCDFSVLVRSLEELLQEEKRHRALHLLPAARIERSLRKCRPGKRNSNEIG
jgi:hypothetical protein